MKKSIVMLLCLVQILSLVGCGNIIKPENGDKSKQYEAAVSAVGDSEDPAIVEIENSKGSIIDTAYLDIDYDGIYEDCLMTYGPTSGMFTVVITAYVDGTIKYKNIFNLAYGKVSFDEKDGIAQFVRDDEYYRLFVEDNRIVIENLNNEYEGYWGVSE